ncbi:MAG: DUF4333 domain-containing protein [Bifidobacteriaceae bacterium]|nr:DUF4333 domain-containing protein [Bifidobacteriaceae bacterium]
MTALVTALVVAGAAAGLYFLVIGSGSVLDRAAVEDRVSEILTEDFGIPVDASSVDCPSSMPAQADAKYICSYSATGQSAQAQVTVVNEGQYLVGVVGQGDSGALADPLAENLLDEGPTGWQDLADITSGETSKTDE